MRVLDIFTETEKPEPEATAEPVQEVVAVEAANPTDTVTMDVPLLLRIMEYSKEDAKTDMDLHHVVEKLVELSTGGQTLNMDHYNEVMSSLTEMGGSEAEELVKAVQYDPDAKPEPDYQIKKFAINLPNGMPVVRYKIIDHKGMPATEHVFKDRGSAVKYMRSFFDRDIEEGYGRYWCSTDKRWKERKGPKQSRG